MCVRVWKWTLRREGRLSMEDEGEVKRGPQWGKQVAQRSYSLGTVCRGEIAQVKVKS